MKHSPTTPLLCLAAIVATAQAAMSAPQPAPPLAGETWTIEGFDAFRRGSFGNAGQNLYVSKAGVLQRIYRYDLDGDGHFDLPFANCQEHHESAPSFVYSLDGARIATLQAQGALSGTVADLDGDGMPDIVVAGNYDMVSPFAAADIYYGQPGGAWDARRHIRLQSPRSRDCAVGRFDASGRPSLVFAMPGWGFARICPQSEIGFEWGKFTDLPTPCNAIGVGDFDGDGFDDLACRDDKTFAVTVFWGGEDGLDPKRRSATLPPSSEELLAPEESAGLKSELEEQSPPPRLLDTVTLDGGRVCLALLTGKKAIFLAANADRSLSRVLELDAPMAMSVASGDFNSDGITDLAIAARQPATTPSCREGEREAPHSRIQTSWMWLGSADGFKLENRIAVATRSACSADALDNMVLFGQCAAEGLYTNDALLFSFRQDGSLDPEPRRFQGEDMRRARLFKTPDGEVRIAIVNHYARRSDGYDKTYIYWGRDTGYDASDMTSVPSWCAVDTVMADIDDDGRAEMIVCNNSENSFHKDPGHHIHHFGPDGFEPEKSTTIKTDIGWGVAVADFDRDGHLDILSVTDHWNTLSLFRGGPDGFRRAKDIEVFPEDPNKVWSNLDPAALSLKRMDNGGLRWIAVADLNGDGWLDAALPAVGERSFVLWGGPDGFDFSPRQEFATFPAATGARIADLDKDGRPDLVFGGHTMQPRGDDKPYRQPHHSFLHIYWNGPDGFAESRKCILRADAASNLCMGDFNGDGWLDIFACSYQGEVDRDINSFIYWNRDGVFGDFDRQDLVTHAPSGCLAADFNEDGRVDLAVANHKIFGDHLGYSEVWWNGPEGFLPTRTTKLPTRGPHGMSGVEPGNILTRGPEEYWLSEPRRSDAALTVDGISVAADCPPKTWVKATARAAAAEEALADAEWSEPEGLAVPAGGYVQIRLELGAKLSLSSPRVTRVEVKFR